MDHTQLARLTAQVVLFAAALAAARQVSTQPPGLGRALMSWTAGAAQEASCRFEPAAEGYLERLNQAFWDADAQSPVPLDGAGCAAVPG